MNGNGKTNKIIGILIVILFIAAIGGWTAFAGRGDTIKEYQDQIKDLEREIEVLRSRNINLQYQVIELVEDYRALLYRPLDLTGIEPLRSHSVEDVFNEYRFWNRGKDISEFSDTLRRAGRWAAMSSRIVLAGEHWDAITEAKGVWDILRMEGVISVIVIGNVDSPSAEFSESNHAWMLVFYEEMAIGDWTQTIFIIDPKEYTIYSVDSLHSEAKQPYLQGYVYTSPLDLEADIKARQ